jgi:hypothetical protein
MAGLSLVQTSLQVSCPWTAQLNLTGQAYNPLQNVGAIRKSQTYGTAAANNALGGADEFISYLLSIAASGNSTINLSSITNILQQAGVALVRIKGWLFQLLSTTDDTVNGTLCSSITIGAAASDPFLFNAWGGTTPTVNVYNGGIMSYFDQVAAGFTVTASSNDKIKIVNNDSTYAAKVQITLIAAQS